MTQDLEVQVEAFSTRPPNTGAYTFEAADALVVNVREGGRVREPARHGRYRCQRQGYREVLASPDHRRGRRKLDGSRNQRSDGRGHVKARLKKHAPRAAERLTDAIFTALGEQTVVVVGTSAAGMLLPKLAEQLLTLRHQRTCARILTEVTGKHFATAAHLASYAGIAPAIRRSGTSIRGEHTSGSGNKKLKRALFLSAFAALHHPPSRVYYNCKRAKASATTRPSSPSHVAAQTSSSPCSETEPSTKTRTHRGTPAPICTSHPVLILD